MDILLDVIAGILTWLAIEERQLFRGFFARVFRRAANFLNMFADFLDQKMCFPVQRHQLLLVKFGAHPRLPAEKENGTPTTSRSLGRASLSMNVPSDSITCALIPAPFNQTLGIEEVGSIRTGSKYSSLSRGLPHSTNSLHVTDAIRSRFPRVAEALDTANRMLFV